MKRGKYRKKMNENETQGRLVIIHTHTIPTIIYNNNSEKYKKKIFYQVILLKKQNGKTKKDKGRCNKFYYIE